MSFKSTSILVLLLSIIFSNFAFAEMGIPVQLKLKSPGGTYPTESGLTVKLYVLSPSGCVLREEDFSSQSVANGNLNLTLGTGSRGSNDPNISLNQVYNNSSAKNGLTCIDSSNNVVSTGQSYTPTMSDQRTLRLVTTISSENIIANFNLKATAYSIQSESVGGKSVSDILLVDGTSQLNQSNLNDLFLDVTRFNNLKNYAITGVATAATTATTATNATNATNVTGAFGGDIGGTQSAISVNKIKGYSVSATAPTAGQVLQYNGTQYVPSNTGTGSVTNVSSTNGFVSISNAGTTPSITIAKATASQDGYLASADFSVFNNKLGTSTNMSGDVSGVYNALSVDRIKAINVSSTSPVNGQALVYNGSQYAPLAVVSSVSASAPLSSTGGTSPIISIVRSTASTDGYLASTDFTTFNNKLGTTTVMSGDVSGVYNSLSVDRIKGVTVSSTGPTSGQVMAYNGSQWKGIGAVTDYAKLTSDQTFSSTTAASITQIAFNVNSGSTYKFKFYIIYTSAATTTGLKLGLSYPAVTAASALANIASGADGTSAYFQGVINSSGDVVTATATPAATPSVQFATMEGVIVPSANGNVNLLVGSEVNASNIVIKAGSFVEFTQVP